MQSVDRLIRILSEEEEEEEGIDTSERSKEGVDGYIDVSSSVRVGPMEAGN